MKKEKQSKYKANERFFESVFHMLNQGGVYQWIAERETFTKVGSKFVADHPQGLTKIKRIVSQEYFIKRFKN